MVDYLAFLVVRFAEGNKTGTTGSSIDDYYYTNDYKNGQQIKIDGTGYLTFAGKRAIIQRKQTPDREGVLSLAAREMGHSLFDFPDIEHSGSTYFNHQSFGDFDPMSSEWGGFHQVASLYNPGFRVEKGWATSSDASGTQTFSDFDATGQVHSYVSPSYSGALSNQKYYFTFYTKDPNNHWQANWPVPMLSTGSNAGVLVWRTVDGGSWNDAKRMPITLESAHGKWIWNDDWPYTPPSDKHPVNTGQPDMLNGFDSLRVRYGYIWQEFTGYDQEGRATYDNHLYQGSLFQRGSASRFFAPEHNTNFAFYTNPSTNEITSTGYSRAITPGFAMKDLRWEGGQARVDFVSGTEAYTISQNTTLAPGTWYINGTVTVPSGVTLTISPGATLNFATGTALNVAGSIVANGTSANPITFDFTSPNSSSGIVFRGNAASSSLSYCTIRNANNGVYCDGALLPIQHCTITNCTEGIFLNNIGVSGNYIQYNTISYNTYNGMYLWNSSPTNVANNTISNNGCYGILCTTGSTPYLVRNTISHNSSNGITCYSISPLHFGTIYGYPGENIVTGNFLGAWGYDQSNLYLSYYSSIFSDVIFEAAASSNSHITAWYDWWGSYPPNPGEFSTDGTSSIDYSYALSFNPNSSMLAAASSKHKETVSSQGLNNPASINGSSDNRSVAGFSVGSSLLDPGFQEALDSLTRGNFDAAGALYAARLEKETDPRKAVYALVQLAECCRLGQKRDFASFSKANLIPGLSQKSSLFATALRLENTFLINERQYNKAVANYKSLLNDFSKDSVVCKDALFNLGHIYLTGINDLQKAKQ